MLFPSSVFSDGGVREEDGERRAGGIHAELRVGRDGKDKRKDAREEKGERNEVRLGRGHGK